MDKLVPFFFSFQGRIPRETFWLGFGAVIIGSLVTGLIPVIGSVLGLALLWPQFAIHAKRLHDMGLPGWIMAIPLGISFTCVTGAAMNGGAELFMVKPGDAPELFVPGQETASMFFVAAMVVGLIFLGWVGATPGQKVDNRYGPPPPPRGGHS